MYVTSKLHAVDFYGKWILSDEQQIGPRLEKEIEMYCSKRGFRKLKDIVLLRDLHREERHIAQVLGFLHHLLPSENFRCPKRLLHFWKPAQMVRVSLLLFCDWKKNLRL